MKSAKKSKKTNPVAAEEPVRIKGKFTEKQKKDLLDLVDKELKKNIVLSSTNEYVVNIAFSELKRALYIEYIDNIQNKISGNINYPVPDPPLSVIDDLQQLESITRSEGNSIDANIYMKALKKLVKKLCKYIANNCGNDLVVLRSAGVYENLTTRVRINPGTPKIINCKDGKYSGEVITTIEENIPGNQGYTGRYRDVSGKEPGVWIYGATSNGKKMKFEDLPRGVDLELQVRARGSRINSTWSNTWTWMAR